jgi:SAM-dependent methyltransferase
MKKALERFARRVVPSTSLLSHNPIFKLIVNLCDIPPRIFWHEFRNLPPNHLRIRVGVGNRFFSNQPGYLMREAFWFYHLDLRNVSLSSTIVDIGCGCGRTAHQLRDFHYLDTRFSGRYIGIDVDEEALAWCRAHFDAPRFTFLHSPHASKSYVQTRDGDSAYTIEVPDETVDFVFSNSLLTHLLEPELRNYMHESFRVLKLGGRMAMTFFCLDYPPPTYGGRHTFRHRIGNAAVESMAVPEAAVAYSEAFMLSLAREVGFSEAAVLGRDPAGWQRTLMARK